MECFWHKNVLAVSVNVVIVGLLLTTGCGKQYMPEDGGRVRVKGRLKIMGEGALSAARMGRFLAGKNEDVSFGQAREFARLYLRECRREGVNADIAFAQMCLETDFLRFGGQVGPSQHNYCGLGATDGGGAGATFSSIREGVRAHVQHLKAYGSRRSLKSEKVDPRFHLVKRGSAPYLTDLAGTWATDGQYAEKIRGLIARLRAQRDCIE